MNLQEMQSKYGDCDMEEIEKARKLFKLGHLSPAEQDDALLVLWRTHQYIRHDDKLPDMWKTQLPLLALQMGRSQWRPPCMRMPEWIGYKAARMLSDKYETRRTEANRSDWYTAADPVCEGLCTVEGYVVTQRIHLPLEKDAPHYGSMYRLDDICQYMEEIRPKLGSILDGEVIRDLCNHSPVLGALEPRKGDTIKDVGKATMQAILECINDIGKQTTRRIGPGHGFAIMPEVVAEMVVSSEGIDGGEVFEWDKSKGVGSIYWGTGSGQVALYSHSDLTDKIVVGFKPDDVDQAGYHFRPYSFGMLPGPETEGHVYQGKMQLILRRMKRLVDGGCGLYGVIEYNPQPWAGKISIPLVNQTYPQL